MVIVTGDTHRDFDRIFDFCEECGTTKDDILVILGDAGINYYLDETDYELKQELSLLPVTLLCIHGNHEERPEEICSYEELLWHDGIVYGERKKSVRSLRKGREKCMCKEVENQFDFDEEMKQAEELFKKLKTFDFVEDTIEIEENPETAKELQKKYREQNCIYKKWMLYEASRELVRNTSEAYTEIRKYFDEGKNDEDKEIIMELHDPDGKVRKGKIQGGSRLLQDIYKKLWPELTAQEFMKHLLNNNQNTWICSDTMTSAQQRMNDFLQVIADSDFENVRTGIGEGQQYSRRLCIELYLKDKNEFKKKLKSMENFLNHWHMLGNYCPVPRHFNSARSGFAYYDYWDLTLMKIKEYYDEIEKLDDKGDDEWKILSEELLHGTGDALACKKWLDYFGGWKEFIEKNYMQDFVNGNYEVKPFFNGHSWNKPTPKTPDEFENLFQNASEMIKNRTERIINALIAEYKQEQLLNGIMAKLKAIGAN